MKRYVVACPVCKKKREVMYPEYYRVSKKITTGTCLDCRRTIDISGDHFLVCPDCGKKRKVTYPTYRDYKKGKKSGRCRSCATKKSIARRRTAQTAECCGCVLTASNKEGTRCAGFDTCQHRSECLKCIFWLDWEGFTANCCGFSAEEYIEPLYQVKLQC